MTSITGSESARLIGADIVAAAFTKAGLQIPVPSRRQEKRSAKLVRPRLPKPESPAASTDELTEYVFALEGQIQALKKALSHEELDPLRRAVGLSKTETRLIRIFSDGRVKSIEILMNALYWERSYEDWPDTKIVNVHLSKIRKKLAGTGCDVKNVGLGLYQIVGFEELSKRISSPEVTA